MPPRARGRSGAPATQKTAKSAFPQAAAASSQPPVTPVRRPNAQNAAPPPRHPRPADNTSSEGEQFETLLGSSSDEPSNAPARPIALGSPVKRARKATNNYTALYHKSDLEAWQYTDKEIIGMYSNLNTKISEFTNLLVNLKDAARAIWRSTVYDHYDISIRRNYDENGDPLSMDYCFICRDHPDNHSGPRYRLRMRSDLGTKNLKNEVEKCEIAWGIYSARATSTPVLEYSPANHRTLIALRCAKNARPINTILDDEYHQEVQMLRPGTVVPHPTTVQRDILNLYTDLSIFVLSYFAVFPISFKMDMYSYEEFYLDIGYYVAPCR